MNGSNLWSWHSQQAMVEPSQVVETVRTRSAAYLARYSFGWAPPSRVTMFRRLNPLATRCVGRGAGKEVPGDLLARELVERLVRG